MVQPNGAKPLDIWRPNGREFVLLGGDSPENEAVPMRKLLIVSLIAALALLAVACGDGDEPSPPAPPSAPVATPTQPAASAPAPAPAGPTATQLPAPSPTAAVAPQPLPPATPTTAPPSAGATPTATSVTEPTPVVEVTPEPFFLTVSSPEDEQIVTSAIVEVAGETVSDAVVTVNGEPVDVDADGVFSHAAALEEGINPESTEGRPWGQPLKKPAGAPLNLG